MTDFAAASRSIVAELLKHHPVLATWTGVYEYDAELDDLTADGFAQAQARTKAHLATLAQYDPSKLTPGQRIDHAVLDAAFQSELREYAEREPHKHDPSLYPTTCVEGVYALLARHPDHGAGATLDALQSRLEKIPAALDAGLENLQNAPRVWIDTAIEETEAGIEFLRDVLAPLAQAKPALKPALDNALSTLSAYTGFLTNTLARRDGFPFAVGRDYFDFKLKTVHLLPYDADSLLAFGEAAVRATQIELDRVAAMIDESGNWIALVDALRTNHPNPDQLLNEYRRGLEDAKRFIIERSLVSIPAEESLQIVETPVFLRPTLPYAAYMPPPAFQSHQEGLYYVTPVDKQAPDDVRRDQLLGHNRFGMLLTNVHEGYPGHHLQLVCANRVDSDVRKIFHDDVFSEGWALYCEQLVLDEGITDDPRTRLFQLKDQLWRACRVVIDVKLHLRNMSFDEAVAMLVDVAHLEHANAVAEVRRYTHSPTQPMSYLTGKQQILNLRKRLQSRLGGKFELRDFHDRLLSFGSVPVMLIEPAFAA